MSTTLIQLDGSTLYVTNAEKKTSLSLRAEGVATSERQNSKIKRQNDRAKMKKQSV